MTSLEVTGTDAFLDMPQSSQLLYFHLNSLADDDGFVANPKSIMRNCGAQADDLKLLIAKKFVIAFEDGVCVIKHWRINNFVRKDIYKETKYLDLKSTLLIRPNGAYTLNDDGKAVHLPHGHFNLEDVNEALTQRQPRLGKVRVGKVRKGKINKLPTATASVAGEEFDFSKELHNLKDGTRKDHKIIALYWKKKNWAFDNREQMNASLRRELRPAKDLVGYSGEQIAQAITYCAKEWPDKWTLETVHKRIADVINKSKHYD